MKSIFLIIFSFLFFDLSNISFAKNKIQESSIRQTFFTYVDLIQEPIRTLNDYIKKINVHCDVEFDRDSCLKENKNLFNSGRNELLKLAQITFVKYFEIKKIDAANIEEQDYKNQALQEILMANKLWTLDYYSEGNVQLDTVRMVKAVRNSSLNIALLPLALGFAVNHKANQQGSTSFSPEFLPLLLGTVPIGAFYSTIILFFAPFTIWSDIERATTDKKSYPIVIAPSEEITRFRISAEGT